MTPEPTCHDRSRILLSDNGLRFEPVLGAAAGARSLASCAECDPRLLLIGIVKLPVAPLPQVDFPTIQVSASLPGASPDTMAAAVAQPLETQFAQIPGVAMGGRIAVPCSTFRSKTGEGASPG